MREFLNYFEAMLRSPKPKGGAFLSYILGYLFVIVSVYFGIAAMNPSAFSLAFISGFVFVAATMCGNAYFNNTPNLVLQLPLSPKKSLFYRFLSVLVLFLLIVLFIIAVFLVITLIISGIVLLAGIADKEVSGGDVPEVVETLHPMGVHGGIFAAAYFVFMYFTGMISGFIRDGKIRNIFICCLSAAVVIGMILMRNPFIQESYDKMAVPWLCTALCCAAAIAALGTAIYMGIKQYNKNY